MDWITIFIAFGLVWTGAAFFGFPVGYVYAKRYFWKEIERDFLIVGTDRIDFYGVSKTRKSCGSDVLSAEILLEEAKR